MGGSTHGVERTKPRRQGCVCTTESRRQSRHGLGGPISCRGPEYRGPDAAAARGRSLCHRPGAARFGYATQWQQFHSEDHCRNRCNHRHDVAPRVSVDHHSNPAVGHGWRRIGGRPGNRRVSGPQRSSRTLDVRHQHAGFPQHRRRNRLRHILLRSISRGSAGRRGSGNRLLHHVSRGCSGCIGVRSDDRRGNLLSKFYPSALLPDHGHLVRSRHARCSRSCGDVGSCRDCRGQPIWTIGTQAPVAGS